MRLYPLWQERQTREKVRRVQQDIRALTAAIEAYRADVKSLPSSPEKGDGPTSSTLPRLGDHAYDPTNGTTTQSVLWRIKQ